MVLSEFNNSISQLSRVLLFVAGFYAAKGWRDTRRGQNRTWVDGHRTAA